MLHFRVSLPSVTSLSRISLDYNILMF